jgi:hypothetical protein
LRINGHLQVRQEISIPGPEVELFRCGKESDHAMEKILKPQNVKYRPSILVEGPAWGDAEFYGHWLLSAAKVTDLLQRAKKDDPEFRTAIDTLEMFQLLDFGIMATVFLSRYVDKQFQAFVIDANSADLVDFVLMTEMGFFALTGDRYQMILPANLDMDKVKRAHLELAATEDEEWIHPERLIVCVLRSHARKYQRLLCNMNQDQRLADRRALLFLD